MSIAQRLVNLSDGLSAEGILSAAKGGTGTTTGAGSSTPTISSINYGGDDTATNPAGGATITLTGTNFASGAKVLINQTPVSVVTVVSSTQITFTAPALSAGSYILYVVNLDGSTAIAVPGIQYSGTPAWTTAAGSLGTSYETAPVSTTVSATSDSAVTYSVVSGTLPDGVVINSSGTISGTSPIVLGSTTYTFTVRATDGELQDTDREFSLTINPDVVTWSSANAFAIQQDAASTTTLSATSAAGQTVSYAVDTLPAGLTLSGATVSGTATGAGTTTTTATATAAVTGKTAQQTITWTVSIAADTYFPYTTLLLNAETSVQPFLSDASSNNFSLTAFGDTRASNFSPYVPIASSVYFNGSSDYLTSSGNATIATGEFTIEAWIYPTSFNASNTVLDNSLWNIGQNGGYTFSINSTGKLVLGGSTGVWNSSTTWLTSTSSVVTNRWQHVAITRDSSNVIRCFINGVLDASTTTYSASLNLSTAGGITTNISRTVADGGTYNYFAGYISNVHAANGTGACKYTTTFTPSVYPIAKTSTTVFLACNSRRLVDASTNAFTLTAGGTAAVNNFNPFLTNPSYAAYGSTYFDGTGDYLQVADNVNLQPGTGDFTIELWWYPTTLSGTQEILTKGTGLQIYTTGAGIIAGLSSSNSTTYFINAGSTNALVVNSWNHIALTRAGNSYNIYLNGVQTNLGTTTASIDTGTDALLIGVYKNNPFYYTSGYIADLRIVKGTALYTASFTPPTEPLTAVANTSLLTCQTNQPHTNSQFLDNSTSALTITRTGNATQGSFSPYGANWSNYFGNSTNDNIYAASNAKFAIGTGNFTVEAFVNFSAPSSTGRIFLQGVSGTDGLTITKNSSTSLEIGISGGYITYTWTPNIGQWYHIAVVRSGTGTGQVALYIDGQVVTTGTSAASIAQNPVFIGGLNWAAGYNFPGYISNVRYSNIARTIIVPTAPYQADANTLLLTCQSPNFVDNSHNAFTITNSGTPSTQKFSPFSTVTQTPTTHSVYFDGTGDYLEIANNSAFNFGTGDFTVECWANHSVTSQIQSMVSTYQGSTAGWSFQWRSDTGKLALGHGDTQLINYTFTPTVGTWYHYAVSRTGTSLKLFINGTVVATVTDSTNITSTASLVVGNISTTIAQYTYGYLSNLRVVKGTAVYTSNFTPTTQPLTAVSGTSLLTCQDATIRDNSANNFALTAAGNTTPRRQNPFGHTTSSAQDYTSSVFGSSAYFDGTGDYLTVPTNPAHANFGTSDFGVEGWFYFNTISGTQLIFSHRNGSSGAAGYVPFLLWQTNGTISLYASSDNASWNVVNNASAGTLTANQWYHIAYTRTGTVFRVFVNGVQTYTYGSAGSLTCTQPFQVGMGGPGETNNALNGYVTDVSITKGISPYSANFVPPSAPLQAVSGTVLLLNMDRAAVVDRSGKVVLETVGDAKISTSVRKYGTSSLYFDGTGDYLKIPANAQFQYTGDYTVEFWVYFNSVATEVDIVGNYISNVGTAWMILKTANGTFQFYPSSANSYINGPTPVVNTWYHIAGVRSGSSLKLYVNGVSVGTPLTFSGTLGDATKPLYVGSRGGTTNFLNGYIDDLRITRGYARYTANFTPPAQALLTK